MKSLFFGVAAMLVLASSAHAGETYEPSAWLKEESTVQKPSKDNSSGRAAMDMVQAPGKTIVTVGNNTIRFAKGVYKLAGRAGREAIQGLVDSGACAKSAGHPGSFVACGVKLAGDQTIVVWKLGMNQGSNAVYYVGRVGRDASNVWRDAFKSCAKSMGHVAGAPCKVVAISFDATGHVIWAAGVSIGNTLNYTAENGGDVIYDAFDVPASLLRLKPGRAFHSLVGATSGTLCMGVDVALVVPRFVAGIFEHDIGSYCQ